MLNVYKKRLKQIDNFEIRLLTNPLDSETMYLKIKKVSKIRDYIEPKIKQLDKIKINISFLDDQSKIVGKEISDRLQQNFSDICIKNIVEHTYWEMMHKHGLHEYIHVPLDIFVDECITNIHKFN